MFGLDGAIMPRRPLTFVGRSFETLLPKLIEFLTFPFQSGRGFQREDEGCWLEGSKHPLAHKRIQGGTG